MIKVLISGLLLIFVVSACGLDRQTDDNTVTSGTSDLQISHATNSLTIEDNRLVITLWDGNNRVANALTVEVTAHEEGEIVWQGVAQNYSNYEIPYWVVYPELPHSGAWLLDVNITRQDGKTHHGMLGIQVWDEPIGIATGETAFPSETRTFDGQQPLNKITSDPAPVEAFYETSIAEALQEDQPMLIVFSTPGLCESRICAPVTDTVKLLYSDYGSRMRFIHVEVYEDFETLRWVDAMHEWGLQTEPWVYVINAEGIVEARFSGPVARSELEPIIQNVLNAQ